MSPAPASILGVSFDYHDAAAALVVDGEIRAAAEEERFTRRKHDPSLPVHAIAWCLEAGGVSPGELETVAFYAKPMATYERILATHARVGPRGVADLGRAVALWSKRKLWVGYRIERALQQLGHPRPRIVFAEHHHSHAASAFYPSPFDHAAVLTFDGVGEWATSSVAWGTGHRLQLLREQRFPDSLGLLYSAITAYCGFAVNDGESKVMGLAPYGEPRFRDVLLDRVVHVDHDGAVTLDQRWFTYRSREAMVHPRLASLLDGPPRQAGDELTQRDADLAASVQAIAEEAILRTARHAQRTTGERAVCLAGGVALNCVANGRLQREGPFEQVWVQPAAGDDGGAIGAALWVHHELDRIPRVAPAPDGMVGARLGPRYHNDEISSWLRSTGVVFQEAADRAELCEIVAAELAAGATVGWFQGAMEFGPRALGGRSILADARDPSMVSRLNGAVKRREGFRPFAPAVLAEDAAEWFDLQAESPYMLVTAPVLAARRRPEGEADLQGSFAERLAAHRSDISAATHVDHTARVQTVDRVRAPAFAQLLEAFRDRTGCPVLLNTSFNRRDEPIVRTPADALRCFDDTDLDLVVLERCIVRRSARTAQDAA